MEATLLHVENYDGVRQDTITIYRNLLLVVGKNGMGKTALLKSIEDGHCYLDEKREVLALTMENRREEKEHILSLLWENDWREHLWDFVEENIPNYQRHILSAIHDVLEEYLMEGLHQRMGLQRWLSLKLIQEIAKRQDVLVVIDEPETFMHPLLAREVCAIIKDLEEMDQIVVVASNSEQIVCSLFEDIEQVVRLDQGNDKRYEIVQVNVEEVVQAIQNFYHQDKMLMRRFSNDKSDDLGMFKVVNEFPRTFLSSIMKNNIYTALFSQCIVLGEGSSESVLFDYMEQLMHPVWTREHQVNYMSCLGKGTMPFYFIFLNHIGVRCVCMHDYDNDTNPVHIAYRKAFEKYAKENPTLYERFAMQPDMEHVLDIDPDYKLASIEKPVNVYQHTFVNDDVGHKVEELMEIIHAICVGMEGKDVCR